MEASNIFYYIISQEWLYRTRPFLQRLQPQFELPPEKGHFFKQLFEKHVLDPANFIEHAAGQMN